jgi:hypothetical protein
MVGLRGFIKNMPLPGWRGIEATTPVELWSTLNSEQSKSNL